MAAVPGSMIVNQPAHLAEGDGDCPALVPGSLRAYNMKYCPYAQRTLLALAYKNVKFDIVNINLKRKPAWFLSRTMLEKVPVLERADGSIISESMVTMDYLDEVYPQPPLLPQDPWKKAEEKVWVEIFGLSVSKIYKLYNTSLDEATKDKIFEEVTQGLDVFDKELAKRGTKFFGGSQPGLLDLAIWPWFERMPLLPLVFHRTALTAKQANLMKWVSAMEEVPAVKALLIPAEEHAKFMTSFMAGAPEYDLAFKPKM
ncbi:glutathione S-transferase omega-1 isoform X2 [Hyalella azteca]|nr:glutathione S-transferase omega-1 isoform X2 [Hyalella azteca]